MADGQNSGKRISLLRRTASETRNYRVRIKILAAILAVLVTLAACIYVVSMLYEKSGSFTVYLDKYDMTKYGLTLSSSREMTHKSSRLNAKIAERMTNISGKTIPDNVDMIDGEHNGRNYIAFTFYIQNAGEVPVAFDYQVNISNVTNSIDEAVRLKLYVNGTPTTYAKTKSDGSGAETGTVEFYSNTVMAIGRIDDFKPNEITKFTVVIWIEGNDVDCTDTLIDGKMKADMQMSVVH